MSGKMGNKPNIPVPPPPPPLKNSSNERLPKVKPKNLLLKSSPTKTSSKNDSNKKHPKSIKQKTLPSVASPTNLASDELSHQDGKILQRIQAQPTNKEPWLHKDQDTKFRTVNGESGTIDEEYSISIDRNDVPFFDEEQCTDSEDEFSFPCCLQPNSPRFPPNPRPYRKWDPSFLPSSTNIPTSIGRSCRRCGKPVYLAELYMSSRGVYHSECYKCCLCGKSLDSWSVAEYKGEIFCKGCYRRNFGTHGCGFGVGAGVLQTP